MSFSPAVPLATQVEQHRASDPARSVWVSANAGSGKTHVLTQRVVRLLLAGVPPAKILCLTFTKAAAANMAARVFGVLAQWTRLADTELREAIIATGASPPKPQELVFARRLFARTVETPGGLKIQTIHAFCEKLLHVFPFEANVPARFEVIEELAQAELLERARHEILSEAAVGDLAEHLEIVASECAATTFEILIQEAMAHRARAADISSERAHDLRAALDLQPGRNLQAIEDEMIAGGLSASRRDALAALLDTGKKTDQSRAALLRQSSLIRSQGGGDPLSKADALAFYLGVFFNDKGRGERPERLITGDLARRHPDLKAELEAEQDRLDTLRTERKAAATLARSLSLFAIVDAILDRYKHMKAVRGLLDFDDLIARTRTLLLRSDANWVLYKLDAGIDHILVDEAQDTSEAQWRILEELTGEFAVGATSRKVARSFFAVGDDKQSIFSFQGAAPHMFHTMRHRFARRFADGGEAFEHVRLKLSFRSVSGVLSAVDKIFAARAHQQGLVAADDIWPEHEALKSHLPGLIELWPAQGPRPHEEPRDWRLPVDVLDESDPASLVAARIATTIARLIAPDSPERVCDGATKRMRPIGAGDIMILVRTRGPFFEAMIRALKQAKVPVAGADRLNLTRHIAIMDLIAAGRAAMLPADDLTLACVLKSPLIGLDDDDLLEIAPGRQAALIEALAASPRERHKAAFDTLMRWKSRAALTPFTFYAQLLGADGGRRDLEARLGPEASDAIDEFLRLALRHEREAAPSLPGFLAALDDIDLPIKRDMDTAAACVRVLTVHAAKGLEAKIVFLPDTCAAPGPTHAPKIFALAGREGPVLAWSPRVDTDPPAVKIARDAARAAAEDEYRRLLYVALTRAEERLYIAGFHGPRAPASGCWADIIRGALEADLDYVPAFWDPQTTVLRRLSPGTEHAMEDAAPALPVALPLGRPAWLDRAAPRETSPKPPLRPSSALAAGDLAQEDMLASPAARAALRHGRLMHQLLQYLPDVAEARRREAAAAFLLMQAADYAHDERMRLIDEALGVISAPDLQALFAQGSRAEVAVAGYAVLPGGRRVEVAGQVDRIATGEDVWVADYKTGETRATIPAAYLTQMALYRSVLATLWPGKRLRMMLIWTHGPSVVELESEALEAALIELDKDVSVRAAKRYAE